MVNPAYRPADLFGLTRVIGGAGSVLPQQADQLDPHLSLAADELLIAVESLNVDSASFHQMSQACHHDDAQLEKHILQLVKARGKLHNPVTGSGGMLLGRVLEVGPAFPIQEKPVQVGDRIATLVSLTLTPLVLDSIIQIHSQIDRVDVSGRAILFATGLFARLPEDIPQNAALAILDVAGAPAHTRQLVQANQTVVVIGGGGKSGMLCLFEAKKKPGVRTIAIDYSDSAMARLEQLPFVDVKIQVDARNALEVMHKVHAVTEGQGADLLINVANVPETEMASILSCRSRGTVYFFSMATSFSRVALGAEGVGADLDLRIGNGYTQGHADLALNILRESSELRQIFLETYC